MTDPLHKMLAEIEEELRDEDCSGHLIHTVIPRLLACLRRAVEQRDDWHAEAQCYMPSFLYSKTNAKQDNAELAALLSPGGEG